jgi:hypothetical protein
MNVILPNRPYQLLFEHRPDTLYVYVGSDTNSLELATRFWVEVLSLLHRRKYSRVLIEKEISQPLAVHDVFTLVSQLAHSGHNSEISFAIWDRYYEKERCDFEQLVGTNRGLNLGIFATSDEAESWLSQQRVHPTAKRPAMARPAGRSTLAGSASTHADH